MKRKILAELLGTYALVFFGTGAVIVNNQTGALTHPGIAITFGLIVLAMIYSLGDISGAHINPAVSLSFAATKRLPVKDLLAYLPSQIIGAILASLTLSFLFPADDLLGSTLPAGSVMQSVVLEAVMSFFLMFVIYCVSTGAKEKGITAGIAVASVVLLEAMFGGPISGASMNPARSLGPAIISGHLEHLWIYLITPVVGMLLAGMVFSVMNKPDPNIQ
jgi:aquaporin NIP